MTGFVEFDLAVNEGEQGPIASGAHVLPSYELRSTLAYQDTACGDELTTKTFDSEALANAVATVANTALTFLMCHKFLCFRRLLIGGVQKMLKVDFLNLNYRQLLAMTDRAVIPFAAFHLKSYFFRAANVLNDIGDYRRFVHNRRSHGNLALVVNEKYSFERKRLSRLNVQTFNFQRVTGGDTILFAACFDNCVHKSQ